MKQFTLSLIFTLMPLLASAGPVEIDGIWYYLDSTEKQAEVTKHPSGYFGAIVIPEKVTDDGTEYSVTSIGERAFSTCTGLTSITIPNSVTSIGIKAFALCDGLTSVAIPGSVTSIGEYAFLYCSGLTSVTIEYGVTSIGEFAFYHCDGITSVAIPGSVKSIGREAFYLCRGLTSIIFGNGVTSIGMHAFVGCIGLTSVSIPGSVTSIEYGAFGDCIGLTSVTIGNGVTSIGDVAFDNCESLTTVTIGSGVREIGNNAFSLCPKLTDVTCKAESVPNTSSNAFDNSSSDNATLYVPAGAVEVYRVTYPWSRFKSVVALTEDTPDNTNQYAINDEGTATIVSANHSADGKYVVPSSVTIDGAEYTVTEIGANAFSGCTDMTAVTIPETIVAIGDHAFSGCTNLMEIYVEGKKPAGMKNAFARLLVRGIMKRSVSQFEGIDFEKCVLYVPYGSEEAYREAEGWSQFKNIVGVHSEKDPEVTVSANSYSREYGEANPTFGFISEGVALDGEPEVSCEATATSPVGIYDIVVSKGSVKNYNDSYVNGTLTITKAPLTITAKSYTIKQGDPLPTFEVEYEGFKNNETEAVLSKQVVVTCEATAASEPGEYEITLSGAEAENYDIAYVKGILTIEAGTFKLTYMIDNEVYKVVEYDYGATITPEGKPEGDYVTFVWKDVPETMPAKDVTVYADYETGIAEVLRAQDIKYIYAPNGKRIKKLRKGLNIVVMNDGTVRKVVVKFFS